MSWTPFDRLAARYDRWYDRLPGRALFRAEVACLQALWPTPAHPALEVGVGTGRFADALGVAWGVDPSRPMLWLSRPRLRHPVQAAGEHLPFRTHTFSAVLLVVTLCFVQHPLRVLQESHRVLRPGGWVLSGWIPERSPWATHYRIRGQAGHPLYRVARFHSRETVEAWLREAGFQPPRYRSTLDIPPATLPPHIESHEGFRPRAGFVCFAARRG